VWWYSNSTKQYHTCSNYEPVQIEASGEEPPLSPPDSYRDVIGAFVANNNSLLTSRIITAVLNTSCFCKTKHGLQIRASKGIRGEVVIPTIALFYPSFAMSGQRFLSL